MTKRRKITQREAARLRARVAELERDNAAILDSWRSEYPAGVHIGSARRGEQTSVIPLGTWEQAAISTARRLGYPVIVTLDGPTAHFYAAKGRDA